MVMSLGLVVAVALIVFLLFKNRGLRTRLESAGEIIFHQKRRFRQEQEAWIAQLKQEILKRELQIKKLRDELSKVKQAVKAEQIKERIELLSSEKETMEEELAKEEAALKQEPVIDMELFGKMKRELGRVRIEHKKNLFLLNQYKKRYEDIISMGNKLKKQSKDLRERNAHLEDEVEKQKKIIKELQAQKKAPFS